MSGRSVRGGVRWRGRPRAYLAVVVPLSLVGAGVATGIWASTVTAGAATLPANCSQSGSTVTCLFSYTGSEQMLVVPTGISSVQVAAVGAPGANGSSGGTGGAGGTASAAVPVTAGNSLYVEVGGPGQPYSGTPAGAGGWNGGGAGGIGNGAGGGGASDVRTVSCGSSCASGGDSSSLGSRLVVAGGGGAAGGAGIDVTNLAGGAGGAAGSEGSPGATDSLGDTGGGGGGAPAVSGSGGTGGSAGTGGMGGSTGTDGGLGAGGAGADAFSSGGGGGAGYYGGGGGGGGAEGSCLSGPTCIGFAEASAGGGGGGSSYAPGGAGGVAAPGTSPSVTISYTVPAGTATTLAVSNNQPVVGEQISYTATVTPAPDGGTVTFDDNGAAVCSAVPVSSTGTATCPVTYPSPGSHSVTAGYSGDPNFQASVSASPLDVTVSQAATTTSLASTPNPSAPGQQVTFTATVSVTAPGAGTPTGTVTFYDGATTLGTATLSTSAGSTQATLSTNALATGDHSITASYAGDASFAGSTTGSALLQSVADADLSIAQAGDVSVDATSAAGAVVSYPLPQVSDPDEATVPPAVCTPAPGGTFPIGTTIVTCVATDSDDVNSPVSTSFSVQVRSLLTVLTTSVPTAKVHTWYSTTLQASGGEAPYTWALAPGSAPLPDGLTLSTSGVISGTPVARGQVKVVVQVTDSAAAPTTATMTLTIRVTGKPLPSG